MSIDEDRLIEIGMAAFHRVATAINLYEDITPQAGRIPFSELPDVDRDWWHQQAQRMIDAGAIDLATHRPIAVSGAREE